MNVNLVLYDDFETMDVMSIADLVDFKDVVRAAQLLGYQWEQEMDY